jgi:hypothetical protein
MYRVVFFVKTIKEIDKGHEDSAGTSRSPPAGLPVDLSMFCPGFRVSGHSHQVDLLLCFFIIQWARLIGGRPVDSELFELRV